ncbi:hypothetical protein Sa4125_39450 [Aureimonas sp. SA4125]|uniref:hypothetical protein n=1 Tax=Aureimonas sp. SA4125 TaxID=2826993 RepID=UPI001CC45F66|nr:hypothetical protein [Aureimonas sp. SA4125]BDA86403.1 hypothetical protein Sa4125_39450 [Aureimonas sp. SA4125]
MLRLALLAFLLPLPALADETPDLSGTWQGTYDCAQGVTGLVLTFSPDPRGGYVGTFAFRAVKENPGVSAGAFAVTALYDLEENSFTVDPGLWLTQPGGFVTVPLVGRLSEDGQAFAGEVLTRGCGKFLVRRYLS